MVLRSEREGRLKRKVGVNVIALVGLDLRNDVAEISWWVFGKYRNGSGTSCEPFSHAHHLHRFSALNSSSCGV